MPIQARCLCMPTSLVLQHTTECCNTPQSAATHHRVLQHTTECCNTPQSACDLKDKPADLRVTLASLHHSTAPPHCTSPLFKRHPKSLPRPPCVTLPSSSVGIRERQLCQCIPLYPSPLPRPQTLLLSLLLPLLVLFLQDSRRGHGNMPHSTRGVPVHTHRLCVCVCLFLVHQAVGACVRFRVWRRRMRGALGHGGG